MIQVKKTTITQIHEHISVYFADSVPFCQFFVQV